MSVIFNFLEQLKVENYYENHIELSFDKDLLFISKGVDYYYFMLGKTPNFVSNLCREIIFVGENQHDFKIKKTENDLSVYLENKINKKEIKDVLEKDNQELINLFEYKLKNYPNLSSIFLNYKLIENLEIKKNTKKTKI